jgi:pSer/pThr/pTyr-binding forkhead associated (FHA) protein
MTSCPYCGRANEAGAAFCMDCGKPLTKAASAVKASASIGASPSPSAPAANPAPPATSPSGTRPLTMQPAPSSPPAAAAPKVAASSPCPFCNEPISSQLPFCPHCGRRLTAPGSGAACRRCGSPLEPGSKFCATCGAPLGDASPLQRPSSQPPARTDLTIAVVLLDDTGQPKKRYERRAIDTAIGRQDGEIRFPDDPFLSPLHARISWEQDQLVVRDLGSRNGTWVFLEQPYRLLDGDQLLIGSQVMRFRRLGYPGPHAPEADATKRMGSLIPSADIASLTQLRSDGSARDVIHLSPGRDVRIGRDQGDWLFPYDPSMSGRHAVVRSEDADFILLDDGSRNGVAVAARGAMALSHNSRILVGDKILRIEIP